MQQNHILKKKKKIFQLQCLKQIIASNTDAKKA